MKSDSLGRLINIIAQINTGYTDLRSAKNGKQ